MILVFAVVAVLAVVFGVAAFLTERAEGMSYEPQDLAAVGIPRDRTMTPDDVIGLRFALALRGYRMDEVDDALDRIAAEISLRDETIEQLRADLEASRARTSAPSAPAAPASATEDTQAWDAFRPPAPDDDEDDDEEYVPSDATGDVPADTPVDVPRTPEGWAALDPNVPVEPDPDTPTFVEPPAPANPFRPEVPDIPTYDPWSVTPRSRYTEGPTYVEVEHGDDEDQPVDPVETIAEHQTGYAPAPPAPAAPGGIADDEADAGEDDDDPPPPSAPSGTAPWQS